MPEAEKVLSREEVLGAVDMKIEPVAVPEWGGVVYLRVMTGEERDEYEAKIQAQATGEGKAVKVNTRQLKVALLVLTLVDAAGNRLFPKLGEGINALNTKNGLVIGRLFERAQLLNGLTEAAVEELKKN